MGNCCNSFTREVDREEKTLESSSMHSGGNRIDGRSRYGDNQATTSLSVHARNIENERKQAGCVFQGYHPGFGGISKGSEAELVAAGWPSWMIKDAGEAFKGWVPRKEEAFRNLEKIGEGTYSTVYRALDLERMKIVALKKIKFDDLKPATIRFMAREINILRGLNHPNIIKLEGLVASDRSCNFYLVLEYMEHDLERLASHPGLKFTEPQVKCYMKQLLCGLDYCHRRGILHRDIKGSNLLLDNNGNLKIADFGLANYYDPEQGRPLTNHVVTLWYRSPELLLGATAYGSAVDLWSAGCILAELYAGKPIFPGKTEVDQLHRIFMLCGSPSEDYWSSLKLPSTYIFNPQKPFRRRIAETFRRLPAPALALIETLLSLDPSARQSASHALNSEFFCSEPLPCRPEELPKYPPSEEINAIVRDEEARRQAAGGIKDGIYDVNGKGKMEYQSIPALDINAELYLSILKRRAQDNSWSQQFEPRWLETNCVIPMELPRPRAQNEEISGPEGILQKRASHSGVLAQNKKHEPAQIVSKATNHPAYDCVPKQNDSRHKQSIPCYANEDVRNRYRDPTLLGYGYGLSSSRIRHSRPLPAPAGRPDPMLISRPLPAPEGRADPMIISRPLPVPAGRSDQMIIGQDRYSSEAVRRALAKGKQTRSQDVPVLLPTNALFTGNRPSHVKKQSQQ